MFLFYVFKLILCSGLIVIKNPVKCFAPKAVLFFVVEFLESVLAPQVTVHLNCPFAKCIQLAESLLLVV